MLAVIDHLPAKERAAANTPALFSFVFFNILFVARTQRFHLETLKNDLSGIRSPMSEILRSRRTLLFEEIPLGHYNIAPLNLYNTAIFG